MTIMKVSHGSKETVKSTFVWDWASTRRGPVAGVSNDNLRVPTFMEWGGVGQEFEKETGFEGPCADAAVLRGWMGKQDEHALTGSNCGKEVPKAPEGCLQGTLASATASPAAKSG